MHSRSSFEPLRYAYSSFYTTGVLRKLYFLTKYTANQTKQFPETICIVEISASKKNITNGFDYINMCQIIIS